MSRDLLWFPAWRLVYRMWFDANLSLLRGCFSVSPGATLGLWDLPVNHVLLILQPRPPSPVPKTSDWARIRVLPQFFNAPTLYRLRKPTESPGVVFKMPVSRSYISRGFDLFGPDVAHVVLLLLLLLFIIFFKKLPG